MSKSFVEELINVLNSASIDGGAWLAAGVIVVGIGLLGTLWYVKDWIEGKAKEAQERARRLRLENDQLELTNKARAADLQEGN